jgi:sulfoxide reductase heme-binding subunit YedZ
MNAVWYLMRGSGVVSLLLLTLVMALGVATSNRFRPRKLPLYVTTELHRNASLLAVVFLALHVVTALVDPYASVSVLAVVVPFVSDFAPLWIGLGALSVDLVAALIVTSLLRRRLSHGLWRGLHWAAYAAWPLALVHGLGAGTDGSTVWLRTVNVVCILAVGGVTMWRLLAEPTGGPRPPKSHSRLTGTDRAFTGGSQERVAG